jgi:hypothetical protein
VFVGFIGFLGLMKQRGVESSILFAEDNSINTMNPINNMRVGDQGPRVQGFEGSRKH